MPRKGENEKSELDRKKYICSCLGSTGLDDQCCLSGHFDQHFVWKKLVIDLDEAVSWLHRIIAVLVVPLFEQASGYIHDLQHLAP
mmetsp:Transcript_94904/g.207523  ORF Transcript_94904/g.207523 Transcript_94904/m.207523 type:complete len:85 (-) Transcript_94904:401-655(-)